MKVAFVLLGAALEVAVADVTPEYAFRKDCPNVTVIHDVVGDSWYDGCLGLNKQEKVTTAAACEEQCKADMLCSIWQMTKDACWSGNVVHGCRSRGTDKALGNFEDDLVAGQRIQHGFIKVVETNANVEAVGLKHYPEKTGTQAEQIARCKNDCYTDVTCSVWQYGSDGCWVEHYSSPKKSTTTESEWAKAMITGETIEHTCPPYVNEETGLPWPWIITGLVLGVLALGAIMFLLQKKPKVKKTRAVKIAPQPQPVPQPPPVYFVPQPTMLIPQQSVVMQQPMSVVMQQPMMQPMMQAAPQYVVLR